MTWPDFSLLYAMLNMLAALALRKRLAKHRPGFARTLLASSLVLFILDALAESRNIWHFPQLFGIWLLGVPIENISIIIGSSLNSLLFYLLFAGHPPGHNSKSSK
jgi:hypothetical protein